MGSLEVMSPAQFECGRFTVRVVKKNADGTFLVERGDYDVRYIAWLRPGGGPEDFVCGSLGDPRKSTAVAS